MSEINTTSSAPSQWDSAKPFMAVLKAQRRLTAVSSLKDVRHIEIDLTDSGITWLPGDTLGIWIKNDPELVTEILAQCQLDPNTVVELDGSKSNLEDLLSTKLEITQVHPGFIKHYAQASNNAELQTLHQDSKALRDYLVHRQIVDVLKQFPAKLSASSFISCFRKLTPRQYSIASSQHQTTHSVELCVNQVLYQQDAATRKGAGSSFLGWRVELGAQIPVFVVPNPNFRLPADPATPVILIGPGTGIAPFRAFLQERAATSAGGNSWLFFGNPHREQDYLYQEELEAWLQSGVLQKLDVAFSRDQAEKRYVQHALLEQGEAVFAWLEQGAYVYVCGDARHMAEDVQKALLQIIAEQGAMDATAARQYLVALRQQKRYQRDVY